MAFNHIEKMTPQNTDNIAISTKFSTNFIMHSTLVASTPTKTSNISTQNTALTIYNGTLFGRKFEASIIGDQANYLVYIDDTTAWSVTVQKKNKILLPKDWAKGSYVHTELKRQIEQAQKTTPSRPAPDAVFMAHLSKKWQKIQTKAPQQGEQVQAQTSKPPQEKNPIMQGLMGYQRTWAELYLGAGQILVDNNLGKYIGVDGKLLAAGRNNLDYNQYRAGANKNSKAYGIGQGLGDVAIPALGGGVVIPLVAAVAPGAVIATGSAILTNPAVVRAGVVAVTAQIIDGVSHNDVRKTTAAVASIFPMHKTISLVKQARSLPELMRLKKNADIIKRFSNPDSQDLSEAIKYVKSMSAKEIKELENDILQAVYKGFGKNRHIVGVKEALAKLKPVDGTNMSVKFEGNKAEQLLPGWSMVGLNPTQSILVTKIQLMNQIKQIQKIISEQLNHILNQNPKVDYGKLDSNVSMLKKLEIYASKQGYLDQVEKIKIFLHRVEQKRLQNPRIKLVASADAKDDFGGGEKTKLQLQREAQRLQAVDVRFNGIKFSLWSGLFQNNLLQQTYIFARSLKSVAEIERFIEHLESTTQSKKYFKDLIAQKQKLIDVVTPIEINFSENSGLNEFDNLNPLNTSSIFQAEEQEIYKTLHTDEVTNVHLMPSKKSSIFSKVIDGAKSLSTNIQRSNNNLFNKKVEREKTRLIKDEIHKSIPEIFTPFFSYNFFKNAYWIEGRIIDTIHSENEINIYPFRNLTQADFIRLNIMNIDKIEEVDRLIKKCKSQLHWKRESEYEFKSNDPRLLYLQELTAEALKPGYDQIVLKRVIQMQKQGKKPLNLEILDVRELRLLHKSIIPDFFELGSHRHSLIEFFLDTDMPLEEIDKFKNLINRIYAFASMHTKSNKYDGFIKLLSRYTISRISSRLTSKEPLANIFDLLLDVNPHITNASRSQFNLIDLTLDAYLEKLTQIMKHELNEW